MPKQQTIQSKINATRRERDRMIVRRRAKGDLIQDIADDMGLTRQRVSQVLKAAAQQGSK